MPRMSQAEYDLYSLRVLRRQSGKESVVSNDADASEPESKLHDQIMAELNRRRWFFVHSRVDKPSTNGIGTPDFIIAAPNGKTLWVECKTRTGKMTAAQQAARMLLLREDHIHHIVRSFDEFISVI